MNGKDWRLGRNMLPAVVHKTETYSRVFELLSKKEITPVLIVLGGSVAFNMPTFKGDVDLIAYHLESEPSIVTMSSPEIRSSLSTTVTREEVEWFSLQSYSLDKARKQIFELPTRVPRTINMIENFFDYPKVIYTDEHPELASLRSEIYDLTPNEILNHYTICVDRYREMFNTYTDYVDDKYVLRLIRFHLSKRYYEITGTMKIDLPWLIEWSGINFDLSTYIPLKMSLKSDWETIISKTFEI